MSGDRPDVHNQFDGTAGTVVQVGSIERATFLAGAKRLALTVHCDERIETSPDIGDLARSFVEAERARLLGLAEAYDWSRNPADSLVPSLPLPGEPRPDRRTRQDYLAQAEDYLKQVTNVLMSRRYLLVEKRRPSCVGLVVENPTDRHFREIEIGVWFAAPVRGFDDEFRYHLPSSRPGLPLPPLAPGTEDLETHSHRIMAPLGRSTYRTRGADHRKGHNVLDGWSAENDANGTTIWFDAFDLRPRRMMPLPLVPLDIPEGAAVEGVWRATAGDADGECSGELALEIDDSTVDLAALWEPRPPAARPPSLRVAFAEAVAILAARRTGQ